MTKEQIRNARKSFAAQLTNMIRDFERQTGIAMTAINIERNNFNRRVRDRVGTPYYDEPVSLFKGVYIATESSGYLTATKTSVE